MTTLEDLTADIADDVDDTSGEYGAQITAAVLAAIRYCERKMYYFNETRDETFVTVAAQEWYGAAANANIPTLVRIQRAYFVDSATNVIEMRRYIPEEMEILSGNGVATGQPYAWTYFKQQIRIYPIPNAVYTIRLQLGPYRLAPLVNPTDNNAWLDEAYDMIKARAKYILHKNTLKDPGLAMEALNDFEDQNRSLKAETAARNGTGYVRSTCF